MCDCYFLMDKMNIMLKFRHEFMAPQAHEIFHHVFLYIFVFYILEITWMSSSLDSQVSKCSCSCVSSEILQSVTYLRVQIRGRAFTARDRKKELTSRAGKSLVASTALALDSTRGRDSLDRLESGKFLRGERTTVALSLSSSTIAYYAYIFKGVVGQNRCNQSPKEREAIDTFYFCEVFF